MVFFGLMLAACGSSENATPHYKVAPATLQQLSEWADSDINACHTLDAYLESRQPDLPGILMMIILGERGGYSPITNAAQAIQAALNLGADRALQRRIKKFRSVCESVDLGPGQHFPKS